MGDCATPAASECEPSTSAIPWLSPPPHDARIATTATVTHLRIVRTCAPGRSPSSGLLIFSDAAGAGRKKTARRSTRKSYGALGAGVGPRAAHPLGAERTRPAEWASDSQFIAKPAPAPQPHPAKQINLSQVLARQIQLRAHRQAARRPFLACHGSQMADYVGELELMSEPVCIVWGDQNHLAPADIRETYCALSANRKCQAVHVLPRVKHGFMMSGNAAAFDSNAYRILDELRSDCCGDVRRGWNFCFGSKADVRSSAPASAGALPAARVAGPTAAWVLAEVAWPCAFTLSTASGSTP